MNTPALLKGTTIRMWDGSLKNIEDITNGEFVQSFDLNIDDADNAHLRFNKVQKAEILSISKRTEEHLVTLTLDNDTALTTTLDYPMNMQHSSGSACASEELHGICHHSGWEVYRPDLYYELTGNGSSGNEYSTDMPPLGEGDEVWWDSGVNPPTHINDGTWLDDWVEEEYRITSLKEEKGSFEVYAIEGLKDGSTVWANNILVGTETDATAVVRSSITGSGDEIRAHWEKVKDEVETADMDLRIKAFKMQNGHWPADKGDILEWHEKNGIDIE